MLVCDYKDIKKYLYTAKNFNRGINRLVKKLKLYIKSTESRCQICSATYKNIDRQLSITYAQYHLYPRNWNDQQAEFSNEKFVPKIRYIDMPQKIGSGPETSIFIVTFIYSV